MFNAINHKSLKMKKITLLLIILSVNLLIAQNMSYTVYEFKVKDQAENGLIQQFDSFMKDAKIQENGTLNIEKFKRGAPRGMTHRMVRINEIGRTGNIIEDATQSERGLFWQKVRSKVEFGTSFSGRMLSFLPGDFKANPIVQIWHVKLKNPIAFKSSHDKFFNSIGNYMDGKTVGFGTIDVGSPDGATHWIAIATNQEDGGLLKVHHDFDNKFRKQQSEWWETNGGVEFVDNFSFTIKRSYN
tara:strand:+ start:473 stop:1201 length:729 start_codon:yes stop_codon:yes gene_type:complete